MVYAAVAAQSPWPPTTDPVHFLSSITVPSQIYRLWPTILVGQKKIDSQEKMPLFQWKKETSLIVVVDAYNPSTQTEAKPRGSQGPDQSELHSETLYHTQKNPPKMPKQPKNNNKKTSKFKTNAKEKTNT